MGTEVQSKSYLPGYCTMRELDEDVSSASWHLNHGNAFAGGQYYDGHFQGTTAIDSSLEHDRDLLKQKMIEHDTVFRRQVSELHRLYRTQRDLMDEVKRSQLYNHHKAFSLNPLGFQRQDSGKRLASVFPSPNSTGTSPSVLGTEHSSPSTSFLKGKTLRTNLPSAGNGDDDDCEIIECRPGKVRRKMFDLQLSADEYIDPDEVNQNGDGKTHILASGVFGSCSNGQSHIGGSRNLVSTMAKSKKNGTRDLNEPMQIEDSDPPVLDFINQSRRDARDFKPLAPQSQPMNVLKETALGSQIGGAFRGPERPLMVNKENGRVQASHAFSVGQVSTQESYLSHHLQPGNSHGRHYMSYGTLPVLADHSQELFWNGRTMSGPKISEHSHQFITVPQVLSSNHYAPSGELVNSWPYPVTALEKFGYSSSQLTSEKQLCFNASVGLSKSSQASNKPSKIFGQHLLVNSSNDVDIRKQNEVDHGSSSGSKEESICYPSERNSNLSLSRNDAKATAHPNSHIISLYSKRPICIDLNSSDDLDLNATVIDKIYPETAPSLPWLKPKPVGNDSVKIISSQASSSQILTNTESRKITSSCITQTAGSASSARKFDLTNSSAPGRVTNGKMILACPIFAKPKPTDTDFSCGTSPCMQASMVNGTDNKRKLRAFDMNLPCEMEVTTEIMEAEKHADYKVPGLKNVFDLNSCLAEDETSTNYASGVVKGLRGIDLEAPAPLEIEEDNYVTERCNVAVMQQTHQKEELENVAAEAIFSIFSSKESHMSDRAICECPSTALETLNWFVDVVSSLTGDYEQPATEVPQSSQMVLDKDEPLMITSSEETDSFEQMTLNLIEMTAEEYTPKNPFLLVSSMEEEPVNTSVSTRPRRGQARRGRPKRDFQRDILPGLSSLSRHEVTEDLQAFGGRMRAAGHPWQFGRSNKPRRGRPRPVNVIPAAEPPTPVCLPPKQLTTNCIEVGVEDRSLTGWGKTTRRPRRQRCPPGNNLQPIRSGQLWC